MKDYLLIHNYRLSPLTGFYIHRQIFARNSLLYLQEIGSLRVHKPHSTGRSNLSSYCFLQ